MRKTISILHIVHDDKKFFNRVINKFDADNRLENTCVMLAKDENTAFSSIPKTDRIIIICRKNQIKDYFRRHNYDIIFLYSFSPSMWWILDYVPKQKIVIWWAWGYDIYAETFFQTAQLIPTTLYKPFTLKLYRRNMSFLCRLKQLVKEMARPLYHNRKTKTLSRINYFQPVIEEDYQLMKMHHQNFRAKEFYYPNSFGEQVIGVVDERGIDGDILFGNSASFTNNHIDVWNRISEYIPSSRRIIVPLNYGDSTYARCVMDSIIGENIVFLTQMLDRNAYLEFVNQCSYFVCGITRQQAMGNIVYCIMNGIKIFLYRDSVVYKWLKNIGVIVFAIEDIDVQSFVTPLPKVEANHNIDVINNEIVRRQKIYEDFIDEILFES